MRVDDRFLKTAQSPFLYVIDLSFSIENDLFDAIINMFRASFRCQQYVFYDNFGDEMKCHRYVSG